VIGFCDAENMLVNVSSKLYSYTFIVLGSFIMWNKAVEGEKASYILFTAVLRQHFLVTQTLKETVGKICAQ
jgi:hypothetical protein